MFIFRRLAESDLDKMRDWRIAPDITKHLFTKPTITKEDQIKWFEGIKDGESYRCWIINYDGRDIGFCTLSDIDWTNRTADPGTFICEAENRGKGMVKHIVYNVLRYGFEEMNLLKILGPIVAANVAPRISYEKIGFKVDGPFEEIKSGKAFDIFTVTFLSTDWEGMKGSIEYDVAKEFEGY